MPLPEGRRFRLALPPAPSDSLFPRPSFLGPRMCRAGACNRQAPPFIKETLGGSPAFMMSGRGKEEQYYPEWKYSGQGIF